MCKLQSVCVKLSHLNATPIPASLKGLSVHVDFQLIVRIFDFCFVLVSKFGLLMCSFNGVLVACVQTSPISFVARRKGSFSACNKGNRRRLHAGKVLVACENSRHSYLGTVFVVDESM